MKGTNKVLRAESTLGMFAKEGTFTLRCERQRRKTCGGLDQNEFQGNQSKMS